MKNEIYTISQYGKIIIDIRTIMDDRGISRNALARAINARFEVCLVDVGLGDFLVARGVDADVLARICFVLECTPGDIIRYIDSD